MLIPNNIIVDYVLFNNFNNGIFSNNTFLNSVVVPGQKFIASITLHNFTVRNNIKVQNSSGLMLVNCTVQNNTDCTGAFGFGTTNGNVGSVDMTSVFVGWSPQGNFSTDGRYALRAASPTSATGLGGAYRGAILNPAHISNNMADNYVISGMPPVPSVFRFDVPTSVSTGTINML